MNNQEIALALRDLEPEEASQIALKYLREQNFAVKVWDRDDIIGAVDDIIEYQNDDLDDDEEPQTVSAEEMTFIANHVQDSYYWRKGLQEASDSDWDKINVAIHEARSAYRA